MVLIETEVTIHSYSVVKVFPSPCGDYGSYRVILVSRNGWLPSFPSPCGDYGSYPRNLVAFGMTTGGVSVPLRGLWFLSSSYPIRPYRYGAEFPSPCGDYGSYQMHTYITSNDESESFRPLAGIMVLIVKSCHAMLV